ncbi:hypothetical protein [Brachyspira sp.]|uniref:hypothetical protein n=1 Tax=Brachyspira sp. TaxID=1977261 RepID=UPI003D7E4ADE
MPTSSTGTGDNTVTSTTLSTANNIDSPVVVVSGDKLIIAYGEGNNIKYRTSGDGGDSLSKAMTLDSSAKYPYIFFDGTTVSAIVTKYNGKIGPGMPLAEIKGTFELNGEAFQIKSTSSKAMDGIINADNVAGGCSVLGADKYFGSGKTIRTAAGAGIGIGNSRQIPLSEVGGNIELILEAKEITGDLNVSGWGWDLKKDSRQTTKGNNDVIKIDKNGSIFKTSEAAEKSESYSITANGKITGISSSPTVGNNTRDASIATDGKGNIYTLTIEDGGLIFRKFKTSITEGTIK